MIGRGTAIRQMRMPTVQRYDIPQKHAEKQKEKHEYLQTQLATTEDTAKKELALLFESSIISRENVFSLVSLKYVNDALTIESTNPVVSKIITILSKYPMGEIKKPFFFVQKSKYYDMESNDDENIAYVYGHTDKLEFSTMCDETPENLDCLQRYAYILNVLVKYSNIVFAK